MKKAKKHFFKKWEISIIELKNSLGKKYKVTKRIPELKVSETKIFKNLKKAKQQFEKWLK